MDTDSKCASITRSVADVLLLGLVGLAVLLVQLLGTTFQRGYFCDDDSIKYPYHDSTVSSIALLACVFLVPIAVIGAVELTAVNAWKSVDCSQCQRSAPRGLAKWVKRYGVFLFGAGVANLVVDMGKLTIGRLRPHFLDVCKPAGECTDTGYVTAYTCTNDDAVRIDDARKSFPSGHAALSFYTAVYLIMYLQCAFRWRRPKLLLHVLQVVLLVGAWFTALSRVTDNKHHWSDVSAGLLIGVLLAVLTVVFVSDLRSTCPTCRSPDSELLIREA